MKSFIKRNRIIALTAAFSMVIGSAGWVKATVSNPTLYETKKGNQGKCK